MTMLMLAVVSTLAAAALAGPQVIQNVKAGGVSFSDVELQFYDKNNKATDGPMVPGSIYISKGKVNLAAGVGPMQPDWTLKVHASHHEFFGWMDVCDLLGKVCTLNLCDIANSIFGDGGCKYLTNNEEARSIDVTEIGKRTVAIPNINNPIINPFIKGAWQLQVCMYDSKGTEQGCFGFTKPTINVTPD